MLHSNIVGGSTAKRVINCPGSVALVQKMPPKPSSEHADRGTLLHNVIAEHLEGKPITLGVKYETQVLTQELVDEKLTPALKALDEVDPTQNMVYEVETRVGFGDLLPGVFGSTDLIGRVGNRAVVLDWKFGSGVAVSTGSAWNTSLSYGITPVANSLVQRDSNGYISSVTFNANSPLIRFAANGTADAVVE